MSEVKYKTKPFDCWDKAKELTLGFYLDAATAKEKGKLSVFGCATSPFYLLAGFGDYVFLQGEPLGAVIGSNPEFSLQCMRKFESRGYPREMCAYTRNVVGSMLLDKYLFTGGPFPKFDFIWGGHYCPFGHPKWHQIMAEHQGIPLWINDDDLYHQQSGKLEQRLEYVTGQVLDSLEWIEKITGRRFDEEKAIEEVNRNFKCEVLWGEILLLSGIIPTPVDLKSLYSFVPIAALLKGKPSANEFLEMLRDELKDRVSEGIAAVPDEKYRLILYQPPPWSTLRMFRDLEKIGVVFLAPYWYAATTVWSKMDFRQDGSVGPTKTPDERGWPAMKSREDIVRTIVRWRIENKGIQYADGPMEEVTANAVNLARQLKADGIVLTNQLGCLPSNYGLPDYKLAFQNAGFPVTILTYNFGDYRDNDDAKMMRQMEAFIESLEASKE